jgi:arsenate reductase
MAQAFLNSACEGLLHGQSAGLEPGELNPLAVAVMREAGIDISKNSTQSAFDLYKAGKAFAYVITVCDEAAGEQCPIFPGVTRQLHWSIADPSALTGTWEERLAATRLIRDRIKERVTEFCADVCPSLSAV